ncbi:MAG: VCBS repeat-containing protein [Phycisphaerae bacterium]|nr:VCBS repeat-containing protein [Saprospiraceae bacterium]
MSKKTKRPVVVTTNSPAKTAAPSSRRKYLLWGLGLLLLACAAYYFIAVRGKNKAASFSAESGSEPTLTAKNPRLQLLTPAETGVDFQNYILEDNEHNIVLNLNQYNGGGVAVADINNDNLPDLYFVSCSGKNRLYLNEGNLKFKDITDAAGVGSEGGFETSVTAADVNADGWLDLYVCRAGSEVEAERRVAKLFINNQNLTFTERAEEFGLADKSPSSGANFFDYDNDGDLDCYVVNHPTNQVHANRITLKYGPDGKTTMPDLDPKVEYDADNLYQNEGGKFVNVSKQAGIQNFGFGLSVSVTDINADGWPDIYVGNDYVQPDNFFINDQKGGFTDQMNRYFQHNTMSTMGTDLSDYDNDGRVDLMAVDMFPATNYRQKLLRNSNSLSRYLSMVQNGFLRPVTRNVLQHNNGNGTFSDVACLAGVYKTDWSWSCLLADLDNDGLKDLHVANGYRREVTNRDYMDFFLPEVTKVLNSKNKDVTPFNEMLAEYKVRNFVYQNKGNWQFEDKSGDWMTMPGSWSGGGAWADFDADGDLDLVVNNLEDPAFIYKNLTREQNGGNYLQAKLQGSPANPFAVGASVLIEYAAAQTGQEGIKQYQELNPNHGIFSSVEHLIHFGLGQTAQIDRFTVRWPDGKTQTLTNVPANQRLQLKWTDASGYVAHLMPLLPTASTLFSEKNAASLGMDFEHKENPVSDFETWVLYPWTMTDLGPLMAQADVNGDGLEDFFIGNSAMGPSAMYLQTAVGTFRASSTAVFKADEKYEDHSGLFFDADGDKDLDLFVLSGGADAITDRAWQCRLYLNDGKGNFSKSETSLPVFKELGLRAAAHDYDGDGDLDLFIGGRLTPKNWPLTPRSVVLQNNGGNFVDVTSQVGGSFEHCGMVTDLAWSDLNGDGQKELVAVGEWMPVSVFQLKNNKLEAVTEQFGFAKTNGLWNRLALADLDKDGDLDLVTGNLGLNTRFTASADAPFRCYAKDFDNNGTLDPIVAFMEGGKIYPLLQKEVLVKQMPVLKKKFLYSTDYAKATMSDLWPQKDLDAALNLFCYQMETCWWENQGGKFVRHSLPTQAQTAPVQGIVCEDFNGDGNLDILMAGNKYGYEVETNPCDAGTGTLLLGDGKGHFAWLDNMQSGFWAEREARDLALLRGAGGKRIIVVANNNSRIQIFK